MLLFVADKLEKTLDLKVHKGIILSNFIMSIQEEKISKQKSFC